MPLVTGANFDATFATDATIAVQHFCVLNKLDSSPALALLVGIGAVVGHGSGRHALGETGGARGGHVTSLSFSWW